MPDLFPENGFFKIFSVIRATIAVGWLFLKAFVVSISKITVSCHALMVDPNSICYSLRMLCSVRCLWILITGHPFPFALLYTSIRYVSILFPVFWKLLMPQFVEGLYHSNNVEHTVLFLGAFLSEYILLIYPTSVSFAENSFVSFSIITILLNSTKIA